MKHIFLTSFDYTLYYLITYDIASVTMQRKTLPIFDKKF